MHIDHDPYQSFRLKLSRSLKAIMLSSLLLTGCSSLERYRTYRATPAAVANQNEVRSTCAEPSSEFEELIITYPNNEELRVAFHQKRGFGFVGIPLVPFIPFWKSGDSLRIAARATPGVDLDGIRWSMQIGNELISSSRPLNRTFISCGQSATFDDKISAATGGQQGSKCSSVSVKWIHFPLGNRSTPNNVQIILSGIKINGVPDKERRLHYEKSADWHYIPFGTQEILSPAPCK